MDEEFFVDSHDSVLDIPAIQQRREGRDPHVDSFGTMHSISFAPSDTPITKARHEAAVEDLSVLYPPRVYLGIWCYGRAEIQQC